MLWPKYMQKGLKYIWQLYEKGHVIEYQKGATNYGLSIMDYNSLITAIPKRCKELLRDNKKDDDPHYSYEKCIMMPQLTKKIYRSLNRMEDDFNLMTVVRKWEQILDQCIEYEDIVKSIVNIKKITNIPKYRSFQFRLMNHALITNVQLCYWKKRADNCCTFCGRSKETVKHLFAECVTVISFLENVRSWADTTYSLQYPMKLDPASILLNDFGTVKAHVHNVIGLVAKQYVYRQRCKNSQLNIYEYKAIMYQTQNAEKYYAVKNNKLSLHLKKWTSGCKKA